MKHVCSMDGKIRHGSRSQRKEAQGGEQQYQRHVEWLCGQNIEQKKMYKWLNGRSKIDRE